jgi:hypothetical protein
MATASALRIPYAWVEQTRQGGKVVLPLVGSFGRAAFTCLIVGDDGTAHGRFHSGASFMRLRQQRDEAALWRVWSPRSAAYYDAARYDAARYDGNLEGVAITTTEVYRPEPFTTFEAGFAFGVRLPGWYVRSRKERDGFVLMMSHFASGSWATVIPGTEEHRVYYEGPRRLWEELEAAYQWWTGAGRPDHTRFGVTVTREGQSFWLDTPDQFVSSM